MPNNDAPDKGQQLTTTAQMLSTRGESVKAEALFKEALEFWKTHPNKNPMHRANCMNNLALLYEKQSRFDEAIPLYLQTIKILREQGPTAETRLALSLDNLAQVYRRTRHFAEAEPLFKEALVLEEKHLKPEDEDYATTMFNLSLLYLNQGRYAECEPLMTKSLIRLKYMLGENNPDYRGCVPHYVELLRKTDRAKEAAAIEATLK